VEDQVKNPVAELEVGLLDVVASALALEESAFADWGHKIARGEEVGMADTVWAQASLP
jgi:hypothetical protein